MAAFVKLPQGSPLQVARCGGRLALLSSSQLPGNCSSRRNVCSVLAHARVDGVCQSIMIAGGDLPTVGKSTGGNPHLTSRRTREPFLSCRTTRRLHRSFGDRLILRQELLGAVLQALERDVP